MTPDKEDILDAADTKWHYDYGMETTTKKAAYEAMDVYAEMIAIEFAKEFNKGVDDRFDVRYKYFLKELQSKKP